LSLPHLFRERRARRAAEITLAGAIALSVIVAPGLIRGHGSRSNQAGAVATTSSNPSTSSTSTTVAPVALTPVAPPNPTAPVTVPDEQAFRHRWVTSPTFRLSVAYDNATPAERDALTAYLTPAPPAPAAPAPKPAATPAPRAAVAAAPVARAAAPSVPDGTVWDRIAACESGGNWADNTGNGYSGGLQFSPSTWLAYGGGAYAPYAWEASREAQIAVATNIYNAQHSYRAWPVCGRRA